MERRRIGNSSLEVSVIGVGCNNFGGRLDQAATDAVVSAALDRGVNFFDTAESYGGGASEQMLGVALGARRADVVIATKFGRSGADKGTTPTGSRGYINAAVDASLQRLGTDYIDLYQMHRPDPATPIEETLGALGDLVKAGKIRYFGNSNFSAAQIAEADAAAGGQDKFVSAQNLFSLLEQGSAAEILPACERYGLGFLPFFPLASGLLTGKYRRGEPPAAGTRLAAHPEAAKRAMTDNLFDRVEALSAWADRSGHSLLDLAFAWLLAHGTIPSVIAGATSPAQVAANTATSTWRLSENERAEVARLAQAPVQA